MAKKFLMALDRSMNSLRAVEFVADNICPTAEITLMSVVADPAAACELQGPSEGHPLLTENIKELCVIEEAHRAAVEGFLSQAKQVLVNAGFSEGNLCVKLRRQETGIASDILAEAAEGDFGAIVMGRRGVAGKRQFAFGSVSNKILNHAGKLTVIVVD